MFVSLICQSNVARQPFGDNDSDDLLNLECIGNRFNSVTRNYEYALTNMTILQTHVISPYLIKLFAGKG